MDLPYSLQTYEKLMKDWIDAINRNECISVLGLERSAQLYRLNQFLNNKSYLKKHVRNFNKTNFLVLDLESELMENEKELYSWFKEHVKKNRQNVIIVLSSDRLIQNKQSLLSAFEKIYRSYSLPFIFFFHHNIRSSYYQQIRPYHIFFQNIQVFPLFQLHDRLIFIHYLEKVFLVSLPRKEKERIAQLCGGSMWFIKEAVREYTRNPKINQSYRHEEMNTKLHLYYEDFLPEEKDILQSVASGSKPKSSSVLDYLLAIGIIEKNGSSYIITIPVFNDYLQELARTNNIISVIRDNIIQNNIHVNSVFADRERKLLIYFIQHSNKLISRDTCAKLIWGNQTDELYTDWALDQSIRRLRKKLLKLKLSPKILVSYRKKGYMFVQK